MVRHHGTLRGDRLLTRAARAARAQPRASEPAEIKSALLERLQEAGFDAAGIAGLAPGADLAVRFEAFIAAGWHGEMDWLAKRSPWRGDPKALWPSARTAIVAAKSYAPRDDLLVRLAQRSRAAISAYTQGTDYHDVLKRPLKRVARWLSQSCSAEVKVFVDTAPLMEKPLAEAAGIGWQGKHTNLVSREHGSWLFLGVILTDLALPADAPHEDHCGSCRACLDICPTAAFPAPYQLDARRCISYLTIEHDGPIPRNLRAPMGNRIYGCDDCLAVCPWNKFAAAAQEAQFHPRAELRAPLLATLAGLDDAGFREVFAGSAIKRAGRERFVRNVMIAIGNSGDLSLVPDVLARLDDFSPLVRGAAAWALSRLSPEEFARLQASRSIAETDASVRAEWIG